MLKRIFLCATIFTGLLSFSALAFTSDVDRVTLKSGDTGKTYTWTSPIGTSITMPIITKDALIEIDSDQNHVHTLFYDPFDEVYVGTDKGSVFGYGYKKKAFAAPTLSLSVAKEYTPMTISNYNISEPALSTKYSYQGKEKYQGKDAIFVIDLYADYKTSMNWNLLDGTSFEERNKNYFQFYYVSMNPNELTANNTASWQQDSKGWWYKRADGSYPKNEWLLDANIWYYFNNEGYMVVGWKEINGDWYFFNNSGAMLSNTTTPDGYKVGNDGKYIK